MLGRTAGADDYDQPQHQQGVGQHRADDRRLGDDQLALLQGEDDDEQLRQVAEGGLHHPRHAGPEALAQLLRGEGHDPCQPRQGQRRQQEARDSRPGAVVGQTGQRREDHDSRQRRALEGGQPRHVLAASILGAQDRLRSAQRPTTPAPL
jgi:hypothetical protein